MKPHKQADLIMQYAKDAAKINTPWVLYEFKNDSSKQKWATLTSPPFFFERDNYRRRLNADEILADMLKPKLTPVDMSVLVYSGIDCWFGNKGSPMKEWYSMLTGVCVGGGYWRQSPRSVHPICKPRMRYWFGCGNFKNPDKLLTDLHGAGFRVAKGYHQFKITGLREGRCWPWECDE